MVVLGGWLVRVCDVSVFGMLHRVMRLAYLYLPSASMTSMRLVKTFETLLRFPQGHRSLLSVLIDSNQWR